MRQRPLWVEGGRSASSRRRAGRNRLGCAMSGRTPAKSQRKTKAPLRREARYAPRLGRGCITVLHHQYGCAKKAESYPSGKRRSPREIAAAACADREIDVAHGFVDVVAYQEALLIEAIFGVALLAMLWIGFRRWLQHKEKMGRMIAEQADGRAGQNDAQMERFDARLKVVEQIVTDGGVSSAAQIDALRSHPLPASILKRGEASASSPEVSYGSRSAGALSGES